MNDDFDFIINLLYDILNEEDDIDEDDINLAIDKLEFLQQQERRRTLNKNNEDISSFPRLYGHKE